MVLGDRMKAYENVSKLFLPPRTPIIIRLDGQAFHTFTRQLHKPFDNNFRAAMELLAQTLLDEIQGATVAYTQSDEISLFLHTYNKFDTNVWFDGNVQKIVSISASFASAYFNSVFIHPKNLLAKFDSRVFVLPKEEVANYFLWRSRDAIRNAIGAYAEFLFGHKAVLNVKTGDKLNMIPKEDWEKIYSGHKFGTFKLNSFSGEKTTISTGKSEEFYDIIQKLVEHQEEK